MLHLGMFPLIDKIGHVVALGGSLVLSILLLFPDRNPDTVPDPATPR
jgi:hypothetical protein